ncbi:MAG: HD domain-containing protein [Candidatus Wallbacteria bacterium]|nr:HD domain-containing protein [Candidatus Wallbacteria bacterium]
MIDLNQVKAVLKPQFGYMGKSAHGEPLWVHSFTVWNISAKILKYIPSLTERERELLEITCLIHDIGKMSGKNQAVLVGEKEGRVSHTQTKEQITGHLREHGFVEMFGLKDIEIDLIYHAHLHHHLPEEALKTGPACLGGYANIVRASDWLASANKIDQRLIRRMKGWFELCLDLTTVRISRPEGPANYLLFDTAWEHYKEHGWDILTILPDGMILIGGKGLGLPEKTVIVEEFQSRLTENSLAMQKPNFTNFASALLAGESAKNPGLYLKVHRDFLMEILSDYERSAQCFLKLLIEMLDLSGKLTSGLKKEFPLLDILKGLCGTRGIPVARKKWLDMGGKTTDPLKEMLREIFSQCSLKQIIPMKAPEKYDLDTLPGKWKPSELFDLLQFMASELFPDQKDKELVAGLGTLINLEEECDFEKIAQERFVQYKEYKEKHNPERGICESCGFPQSFATQASQRFPAGKAWGFSQLKAHANSARATCTLCAYDTMKLRSDVPEKLNQIYIRIESRSHDLWKVYGEIDRLIQRLRAAFDNPYTLEKLSENSIGFLPLPDGFKLPSFKEDKESVAPLSGIRGYLFQAERVPSGVSPKELRARHLSLYSLLLVMGFNAHIGFEEQNGLFGDKTIAKGENYETLYYRGLSIKWLAKILYQDRNDHEKNHHVFAESLLTKSPTVALTKIGESDKVNGQQLMWIVDSLIKSNLLIVEFNHGGEYHMKDLLKDAAFFADKEKGIGHYCIEPEERGNFWNPRNMTKYNTTKPVNAALNAIMQGGEIDYAMERFMRNFANKIGAEEQAALTEFSKGAQQILLRYQELRNLNISEFIKAKNALISSIFLFTRYPNLKEVING